MDVTCDDAGSLNVLFTLVCQHSSPLCKRINVDTKLIDTNELRMNTKWNRINCLFCRLFFFFDYFKEATCVVSQSFDRSIGLRQQTKPNRYDTYYYKVEAVETVETETEPTLTTVQLACVYAKSFGGE